MPPLPRNFTTNPNETMNAEQLARDIKSLPEAHKTLDSVILMAGPIGMKVERVVDELLKLRSIDAKAAGHNYSLQKENEELRERMERERVRYRAESEELLKLREENKQAISLEGSQKTHEHLSRLGKNNPPYSRLDVRVGALVDELKQLREEIYALRLAAERSFKHLHRSSGPNALGPLDEAVAKTVDELLKLRAQGEVNSSMLGEEDRIRIRERMIAALNRVDVHVGTSTVDMVDRLITAYKGLQHVANQKEMWRAFPVGGGRSRVMRGTEDATPHLVSEHVAQAICDDLNKQGV